MQCWVSIILIILLCAVGEAIYIYLGDKGLDLEIELETVKERVYGYLSNATSAEDVLLELGENDLLEHTIKLSNTLDIFNYNMDTIMTKNNKLLLALANNDIVIADPDTLNYETIYTQSNTAFTFSIITKNYQVVGDFIHRMIFILDENG